MKKLLVLAVAGVSFLMAAQSPRQCGSVDSKPRHFMQVAVDGINRNTGDGVMRVSCTLTSTPHTSSKIDSVTAVIGGRRFKAVDIDGVDFGRYFQWEDEGVIPVEVDFARPMKTTRNDSIKFHTIHGVYAAPLNNR